MKWVFLQCRLREFCRNELTAKWPGQPSGLNVSGFVSLSQDSKALKNLQPQQGKTNTWKRSELNWTNNSLKESVRKVLDMIVHGVEEQM